MFEWLIPVVEDWHANRCLLTARYIFLLISLFAQHLLEVCYQQAFWKQMYKCSSTKDQVTLFQLHNLIDGKNVVTLPTMAVDACKDFLVVVVEAHRMAAAMFVLGTSPLISSHSMNSYFQKVPTNCHQIKEKSVPFSYW